MPRGVGRDAGAVEVVEVVGVRHGRHCAFGLVLSRLGCGMLVVSVCFWCGGCRRLEKGGRRMEIKGLYEGEGGETMRCVYMTMVLGNLELRLQLV